MTLQILYWHWLILGMLLALVEIVLPSFTALWFGVGALLVGAILYVVPQLPLGWQLFIWAVASILFTWLWFKYFKPLAADKTLAGLSKEAIVGQRGQVIKVPLQEKRGMLRFVTPVLGAEEWPFICEDSVAEGDRVEVRDVMGNALVVKKI